MQFAWETSGVCVCVSGGDSYLLCWHLETQESMNHEHVASMSTINLMKQIVLECRQVTLFIILWVWWWRCGCLVAWFCCQLTERPAGRLAAPPQPNPCTQLTHETFSHHRLCEHACSLLISEWSRTDWHSPGSPSPLTGLRLWQDPVMGGWPGIVHGCVSFSPCDHARLLVVLSIHYLIYSGHDEYS